jgi:hypothetical protein
MRRRGFVFFLGSAAAIRPLRVRAQKAMPEYVRFANDYTTKAHRPIAAKSPK